MCFLKVQQLVIYFLHMVARSTGIPSVRPSESLCRYAGFRFNLFKNLK